MSDRCVCESSTEDLGPCQTDSLLKTLGWISVKLATLRPLSNLRPCGFLFLRVDCLLKQAFFPEVWIDKGILSHQSSEGIQKNKKVIYVSNA